VEAQKAGAAVNVRLRLEAVAHQGLLFGESALANESKRLRIALPSGNNAGLQPVRGEAVRRR
jgi:hypothetical protein